MPIVSKLKVVMADRDVSVNELSEKVGRSAVNLSTCAAITQKVFGSRCWRICAASCTANRAIYSCTSRPAREEQD